mgnify:CR=1 FL=1
MLRIHFLQHWFNLSDPAVEEALYDSRAMRRFVGIDLGREPAPDETTICKFRHLLEAHQLGEQLFALIREYLAEQGLTVSRGTIVDATIINAPSSTKNLRKQRDPDMHQRKSSPLLAASNCSTSPSCTMAATAANVHDSQVLPALLHGKETRVWGDSAYSGQRDVIRELAPYARNCIQSKATRHQPLSDDERSRNRTKSKVRAKVEHVMLVIKRIFGWAKVRYRGLAKNIHWLQISCVTCGLTNLYVARRHVLRVT